MIVIVRFVPVLIRGLDSQFVTANIVMVCLGITLVDEMPVFADDVLDEQQVRQTQAEGEEDAQDDEQAGDTDADAHRKRCKCRTFSSGQSLSRWPSHERALV